MAKRSGFKAAPKKSPEEAGAGHPKAKRGPNDGWGSDVGRGPTPYNRSMSSAKDGHSMAAHESTAGRGGTGSIGKGDGMKGHAQDVEHPQSHSEFEGLGVGE